MKEPLHSHRALTAGVSAGACVALPALAYAFTLPFDGPHALVQAAGVPFAVGGLVGVGALSLGSVMAERMAAADGDVKPERDQESGTELRERRRWGRAASQDEYNGVPVIARAQNALSEAEAWKEVDALLSDASPVSCDAARSHDIYEIALHEMTRTAQESAPAAAQPAEASSHPAEAYGTSGQPVPDETSAFMAAAGAMPAVSPGAVAAQVAAQAEDRATDLAAHAAAQRTAVIDVDALDLDEPSMANMPAASVPAQPVQEVAVVDYSGHEAMWAQALSILNEEDDAARAVASLGEFDADSPFITAAVAPGRMEAIAEGARATGEHAHVNELLEKEFEQVRSSSVRNTSREYLRVIQGGTLSMPRVSAEA